MNSKAKSLLSLFTTPYGVMALVVLMYLLKAALKITVGREINSPMIEGDGFHNVADILEALAVIVVIWVAKRPASSSYPFGQKNVEFFSSLAIGAALLYMAVQFAIKSAVGLLALAPELDAAARAIITLPEHQPLVMSASALPWVLSVTAGSIILSLAVSRYQIAVGKKNGHASMVADGEETASDGRIEIITLVGVIGEYVFNAPWLEYPLGLVVAFAIAHTGWELFKTGGQALLQHSIGKEHEGELERICHSVPGVAAVSSLKTFQIGSTAVAIITIETQHRTGTIAMLKSGLEHHLRHYLLEAGFKDCELNLRFEKPEPARHRIAYGIVEASGQFAVAPSIESSTHIVVCDLENGMVVRTKQEEKPADVLAFLNAKRVVKLYLFNPAPAPLGAPAKLTKALIEEDTPQPEAIEVLSSTSFQPALLGLY